MHYSAFKLTLLIAVMALAACGGDSAPTTAPAVAPAAATAAAPATPPPVSAAADCSAEQGLTYLCGLQAAEDLLALGDTGLLLASGMSSANSPGHMYLIDPAAGTFTELVHGRNFSQFQDTALFPDCPGPLNLQAFSVHGLSLKETSPGIFSVYTTSHGEREAIEVYAIDITGFGPTLTWRGCVVLPDNTFANSVAQLADGGFVTTKMMDPRQGFGSLANGGISGNVYEWHPGGEVFAVAGTELSGANGITVSDDERYMYVAAFGSREVLRFDRSATPIGKLSVSVDITPDNIRWGANGKLLTAGGNYVSPEVCSGQGCATGWSVLEVDAETLAVSRIGGADQNAALQGASSALQVGNEIWVGTFNGDRVGYFTRP